MYIFRELTELYLWFCYKALRDGKRLITAYWLNNCLLLRRMSVPSFALHFPFVFGKERPCSSQVCFLYFEVVFLRPSRDHVTVITTFNDFTTQRYATAVLAIGMGQLGAADSAPPTRCRQLGAANSAPPTRRWDNSAQGQLDVGDSARGHFGAASVTVT